MQLVSRKILFDVMSHKRDIMFKDPRQLDEVDSNDTAFQSFMKTATSTYKKANDEYDSKAIAMSVFTNDMYDFAKANEKCIRYVDQGSSRMVFALANGTCLKLAMTEAGQAQNKQESKTCMDPLHKYEIFPDFYAADTKDWLALNCELCAKALPADFAQTFKIQPKGLMNVIEFIVKMKLEDWEIIKAKEHFESLGSYVYAYFAQQLADNKTLAAQAIRSLISFYRKNGIDELLPGDLEDIKNWGIAIRDNQKVLVVIDAGFNEAVWQAHYK